MVLSAIAQRLEFHAPLERVQFRPPFRHIESDFYAQIHNVHLRSADSKSACLRRKFYGESPAPAGSLACGNELKFSRSLDYNTRATVENDLGQSRFEPQPTRLQWGSQSRRCARLIPLRVHRAI